MSGNFGYHLVSKAVLGVFTIATFGVWAWKNREGILKQASDTQPDEFIGLLTTAATVELPKVWQAFSEPPEQPLVGS